jgi:methionyl-tRNA formyltransferase
LKIIILGTSQFTLSCIDGVIDEGHEVAKVISMPSEYLPENSVDVRDFCIRRKIDYFETEDLNADECVAMLKSIAPDCILSTWPKIISESVLELPKRLTIGTHPTPLPMNQGRHPLHWMIVLGLSNTLLSFFAMDEGIDTGNILYQVPFSISNRSIPHALKEMCTAGYQGTRELLQLLENNSSYEGVKQTKNFQNYWRKRTEDDVTLDPRMSSKMILRIISSFCPPYPGAILRISNTSQLRISKGQVVNEETLPANWKNFDHGFIINTTINTLKMRIEDSVVELEAFGSSLDLELLTGKKIHPPTYYNPSN